MDYDASLRWLMSLPDFERTGEFSARPDLAPMLALLDALGNPQRGRATLHIAGSKGKGSTAAIAESILRASGIRTGFYLSPHLHRFTERIRLDGDPIAPERFAAAMVSVREAMDAVVPRFPGRAFLAFDALTAAAFVVFGEAGVEVQVVEVGLGGLLDSTNVFQDETPGARVSVITSISLEHTAVLGSTIPEIAAQKAGIITPGDTVVVAPMRESALDVIRARAEAQHARTVEVASVCQMARTNAGIEGQDFKLKTPRATYAAHLPLVGRHQLDNGATAILACEELLALRTDDSGAVTPAHVREGLAAVRWPARLEVLKRRPYVIVDGAHNGDSAKRIVATLRDDLHISRVVLLFGTLADKDAGAMADAVAPIVDQALIPQWPHRRAANPRALADVFRAHDVPAVAYATPAAACDAAIAAAGDHGTVLAMGALSFAAAVREYLLGIESDMIRILATPQQEQA